MEGQRDSSHYTRQLTLPSGRQIEVVYFERTERPDEPDLRVCGGCGSDLVQPVDWASVSRSYWSVTLRCPNCEWSGTGVYEQGVVDRFELDLDRAAAELSAHVERISLENMAESVDQFVAALQAGHVLPSDF